MSPVRDDFMTPQRSVLITGCSAGGIGHALALEYHARGLRVIATARRLEAMEELQAAGITAMKLDVTDVEAVRRVRDEVAAMTGGALDILINNAGHGYTVAITDMDLTDVRELFEVNVIGPICMVQEFANLLINSGDGRIVQVGSIAGFIGIPFGAAYNMSKAALMSFSNTLRVEMAPFNVKVIHAITGRVKTEIVKPRSIPPDSLYREMEDVFQTKRLHASQQGAMPTAAYARQLAPETLKPRPHSYLWVGGHVWVPWLIHTFLGQWGFDWLVRTMFGFSGFSPVRTPDGTIKLKRD
ncbi:NAD-P-binding protein [Vararia minispora EC-137]|uniref:NAD-P-binding protein n=1 Tax=Vararia minispora EC-137 TaxID=1314806 RepID=A0ACB8Q949_9AGAM|nr:NAD-P-binding protein [Vararia minispora EC-137]